MEKIVFNKINFDINKFNEMIEKYCNENKVGNEDVLKIQLINEEFLSNILFPNYDKDVEFSISKGDEGLNIFYAYEGDNYMNKINDETILSLKILQNKTKHIKHNCENNCTKVIFIV